MLAGVACAEPVKVIFDTDMGTDIDDVGALACLHALADAGECEILATVTSTRGSGMNVPVMEIINAYYGRRDLPTGAPSGGYVSMEPCWGHGLTDDGSPFVSPEKWWKHDNKTAPDALEVYRQVLESQPTNSVTICAVGFMTNLKNLLEKYPELVKTRVKRTVLMACAYPRGIEYNSGNEKGDPKATQTVLENWPGEIVFSDFEVGRDIYTGRAVAETEYAYPNPIKQVFSRLLPPRSECTETSWDRKNGHPSWDQTAVLLAVRGTGWPFQSERGRFTITGFTAKGAASNEWTKAANGPHIRTIKQKPYYLIEQMIDELETREPACRRVKPERDAPGLKDPIFLWKDKEMPFDVKPHVPAHLGSYCAWTDVYEPRLYAYPAKGEGAKPAVLVCPGGAYAALSVRTEGINICEWLNGQGYNAFLLVYRVNRNRPADAAHADAERALTLIRENAAAWNVIPNKVGMIGFSAGANLTARTSCGKVRPDFSLVIYPWWIEEKGNNAKSHAFEARDWFKADAQTPPTFIMQAQDDGCRVENALTYYIQLKYAGVPAELHLFPKGGHGYGLARKHTGGCEQWPALAEKWLRRVVEGRG